MRIFRLDEDGCVYHWIQAHDESEARAELDSRLIDQRGPEGDFPEIGCLELPPDVVLTLCGDTIPVKLKVEEWLAVYDGEGLRYLGCSDIG